MTVCAISETCHCPKSHLPPPVYSLLNCIMIGSICSAVLMVCSVLLDCACWLSSPWESRFRGDRSRPCQSYQFHLDCKPPCPMVRQVEWSALILVSFLPYFLASSASIVFLGQRQVFSAGSESLICPAICSTTLLYLSLVFVFQEFDLSTHVNRPSPHRSPVKSR